jgi:hypothetical protein
VIADMVVHNGIAYLAGQVAEEPVSPSVYEQTKNILKQIEILTHGSINADSTAQVQMPAQRFPLECQAGPIRIARRLPLKNPPDRHYRHARRPPRLLLSLTTA